MRTPATLFSHLLLVLLSLSLSAQSPAEEMLVGILFSDTSAAQASDQFAYRQDFLAAQHQCTMAGIPFELVKESKLSNAGNFSKYQVLVIPRLTHVPADKREKYIMELRKAVTDKGLNLISAGTLMAFDENNTAFSNPGLANEALIGVRANAPIGPGSANLTASDVSHPALPGYTQGETVLSYAQFSAIEFALGPLAVPSKSGAYCTLATSGQTFNAVHAIETPIGRRNVHFADSRLMFDANLLWSAVRWTAFGSQPAVSLRTSRQASLFFARADMEHSMYPSDLSTVETPLVNVITDWKNNFGFVASYYLNIGNDPDAGQSTDWSVSGPLYQAYLALGSEMGTHSYSHPEDLSALTKDELKFEFEESLKEIKSELDFEVSGGSVPGNPESLAVVGHLDDWLDYLSGRTATTSSNFGFTTAYGHLDPESKLFYTFQNTSSDTHLIDTLGHNAAQAAQIWQDELINLHRHAPLPFIHWRWHDAGPLALDPGYSREMYENMISAAVGLGAEFVTGEEFRHRNEEFADAKLEVTPLDSDSSEVKVSGAKVGKFALQVGDAGPITSVDDWYAYSDEKVFLPKKGGTFTIRTNGTPADVTRITALPPGAELVELDGDGTVIEFEILGKGVVTVATQTGFNIDSVGADAVVPNGDQWDLHFDSEGPHKVSVTRGALIPPPEFTFVELTGTTGNEEQCTMNFRSNPGLIGWILEASDTLHDDFPHDLTDQTTFTESAENPGNYTATFSIATFGDACFFRIGRE